MNEEFIEKVKNFKKQMKWCAIMCWLTTAPLAYKVPNEIEGWGIITIGAVVFSIIYFKTNRQIIDYENRLGNKP